MEKLIDEEFLKRLANLKFMVKGRRKGQLSGTHSSPRAGVSVEFADYRDYTPGDDFRYVDWNIYGRLDRILVKTFVREVDLPIYILLDLSASMRLGDPSKARYGARFAAAIAYLGLKELERVGLYPFAEGLISPIPPRHGVKQIARILKSLQEISPTGETSINHAIDQFLAQTYENGLIFLISDLFTERGYREGFLRLLYRNDDVVVVHVVDPADLEPEITGSARIEEVESRRGIELNVGSRTLDQYQRRLSSYLEELRTFLLDHRIPYFLVPTDLPLERLIHQNLRSAGVLK